MGPSSKTIHRGGARNGILNTVGPRKAFRQRELRAAASVARKSWSRHESNQEVPGLAIMGYARVRQLELRTARTLRATCGFREVALGGRCVC
jgi:hypothetical protein